MFCRREHARLVRVLILYCGDAAVAEEVAQEALERACLHWRSVRRMQSPGAWLHRVAMNVANSRFRRRGAERRAYARSAGVDAYELPDVGAYLAVRAAVADLPDRWREAVLLRHVAGLSVEETAMAMRASPSAVKTLTSRGLARLRELVASDEETNHAR